MNFFAVWLFAFFYIVLLGTIFVGLYWVIFHFLGIWAAILLAGAALVATLIALESVW